MQINLFKIYKNYNIFSTFCFYINLVTEKKNGRIESRRANDQYEEWSSWSHCNRKCGGGEQIRHRSCKSADNLCLSHAVEKRICNIHSCKPEWSCWSSYSECTRTCGEGYKIRTRSCQFADGTPSSECNGSAMTRESCQIFPCQGVIQQQIYILKKIFFIFYENNSLYFYQMAGTNGRNGQIVMKINYNIVKEVVLCHFPTAVTEVQ